MFLYIFFIYGVGSRESGGREGGGEIGKMMCGVEKNYLKRGKGV